MQPTTRTFVDAVGKSQLLPVSAPVTILSRVCRVDLDQLPAGAFSLVGEHSEEPGPGRVRNAFGETMVVDHAIDGQVLNADGSVVVDNSTRFLMREIVPPEPNPFMDPANHLAALNPIESPLLDFTEFPLRPGQGLFFFPEEPGVVNGSSVRERCKSVQTHVDAHGIIAGRETLGLDLATETYIPFAGRGTANRGGLGSAAHLPVHDELDLPYLGDRQLAVFEAATRRHLGKGEGVIPALAFEAGIAGLFARLDSTEEGFEGQIYAVGHVLQDLGIGQVNIAGRFDTGEHFGLLVIAKRSLLNLPGVFTLFQQTVIKIPALFQNSFEGSRLFFSREHPVSKCFKHLI